MTAPSPPAQREPAAPDPTIALAVLTAINLFNYLDRSVLSAVLPWIKKDFALGDGAAGLLGSMFMLSYLVAAPFSGHLGDRVPRKYIVAGGAILWSLATVASGLARSYEALLATRALIGIGEAGYAIVAPGIIADLYPRRRRARILAIFYVAIPVGLALGYLCGGFVGQRLGWRAAFFVAGAPGLLLAVAALLVREPRRGAMDPGEPITAQISWGAAWARLVRTPVWRINTIASGFMLFALGAGAFWMPTFFVRIHGLSPEQAGTAFGGVSVISGFIGTLAGGVLGDRAYRRHEGGHLLVGGLALLAAAPTMAITTYMPSADLALLFSFFSGVLLGLTVGPLNAALVGCVPGNLRSLAVAANLFCAHLLGDAASPYLAGWISDRTDLRLALALMAVPLMLGALVLLRGAARVRRLPGGLTAYPG